MVQQAFNGGDEVFAPTLTSLFTVKEYAGRRASGYGILLVNLDENKDVNASVEIVNDSRSFVTSSLAYRKRSTTTRKTKPGAHRCPSR